MFKIKLIHVISFCFLLITLSSIEPGLKLPIHNTFIWWLVYSFTLLTFIYSKNKFTITNQKFEILYLYLLWNIVCIVRGVFVAEDYWQWKNLVGTSMVLLLPLSINISSKRIVVQEVLSFWIKYALPAFVVIYPFLFGDASGRYLVPISFLLVFFPVLPFRWKLILFGFSLFVFFGDISARSNIIKFSISIIFGCAFMFRKLLSLKLIEFFRLIFVFLPIILFTLGICGMFNVFKINEYIDGTYTAETISGGEVKEADLTDDTRTFLYVEVIESAIKYDYILFGRTPARGNESPWWYNFSAAHLDITQKERFANEVSVLNIFTWTGLLGVILYFLVFYRASYLAVNRSNNFLMRIVGLNVAFRWAYAWVEDFTQFDLSYLFLWIMIGMCFSHSFRNMTDQEMKNWVLSIFNKGYKNLLYR